MANNLTFNPYQLPQSPNTTPSFDQNYFNQLQGTLGNQMQGQADFLNQFQQQNNLSPQGSSNTDLLQQVLGSPQQQINKLILPQALQQSSIGQGQNFQSQYEQQAFENQLAIAQRQYEMQRSLLELQKQLMPQGYRPTFGDQFQQGVVEAIGGLL